MTAQCSGMPKLSGLRLLMPQKRKKNSCTHAWKLLSERPWMSLLPIRQSLGSKYSIWLILKGYGLPVSTARTANLSNSHQSFNIRKLYVQRHVRSSLWMCYRLQYSGQLAQMASLTSDCSFFFFFFFKPWPVLESAGLETLSFLTTGEPETQWHSSFGIFQFLFGWFNDQNCCNLHILLVFLPPRWS